MTAPLTSREAQVLRFLRSYTAAHGYPPSMRETARACGLEAASSVKHVLDSLAAKGYITRVPGAARSIVVHGSRSPSVPDDGGREKRAREARDRACELMVQADAAREQAKAHLIAATAANDQADAAMATARRITEEWFLNDLRSLFDMDSPR